MSEPRRAVDPVGAPHADPFDAATTVVRADDGPFYDATLSPIWAIGPRPHGGYLLAVVTRAAGAAAPERHPDPLSTSTVFLSSPRFGPARIQVEVLRTGRSVTHVQSTLLQDDVICLRTLHLFGRLDPSAPVDFLSEAPPEMAPWEQCAPRPHPPAMPDGSIIRVGIAEVTELRMDPGTLAEEGPGTDRAELRAWLTFLDGRDPDPLALLFALDGLPPVTFGLGLSGWVPTLELTAYIRARPAPGPLQVRQRGRLLQDDRIDEVCDVWDSAGHLVAQGTQLAGVRVPR
jgi:hypothetical protein